MEIRCISNHKPTAGLQPLHFIFREDRKNFRATIQKLCDNKWDQNWVAHIVSQDTSVLACSSVSCAAPSLFPSQKCSAPAKEQGRAALCMCIQWSGTSLLQRSERKDVVRGRRAEKGLGTTLHFILLWKMKPCEEQPQPHSHKNGRLQKREIINFNHSLNSSAPKSSRCWINVVVSNSNTFHC